jgi:ribosomal protein L34E
MHRSYCDICEEEVHGGVAQTRHVSFDRECKAEGITIDIDLGGEHYDTGAVCNACMARLMLKAVEILKTKLDDTKPPKP